jgi:acyl carrier protein
MTRAQVHAKLAEILTTHFRVTEAQINDDANFKRTFGLDSLDVVDLVFFIQKGFGFKSSLDDYRELHTFGKLVDYLHARMLAQAAQGPTE